MKINLPVKQGDLYVKYDANNIPEYAFKVKYDKHITEFINMKETKPNYIVLPKLNTDAYTPSMADQYVYLNDNFDNSNYLEGNIRICKNCFKGVKDAKIIVPQNTSVVFEKKCFDKKAKVEIIAPKNLELKQMVLRFDPMIKNGYDTWTMLCDNNVFIKDSYVNGRYFACNFEKDFSPINFEMSKEYTFENDQVLEIDGLEK